MRWSTPYLRSFTRAAGLAAAFVAGTSARATVHSGPDWLTIGNGPENNRHQPSERTISTANVSRLAPKWIATTAGDVSATPAVEDGALYFGDFGGTIWKLDAATGRVLWSHAVADARSAEGSGNNKLYAFSLDGK